MKVKVRVGAQSYEVEIGDLDARPIIATIAGEAYEVWPEPTATTASAPRPVSLPSSDAGGQPGIEDVLAPLPGVVTSVAVEAGAEVQVGQELCVIEAMKMQNAIRSPRAGTIAAVHVQSGQHVRHRDPLIEFVS
jgi:biotin carboxyl carrier protein